MSERDKSWDVYYRRDAGGARHETFLGVPVFFDPDVAEAAAREATPPLEQHVKLSVADYLEKLGNGYLAQAKKLRNEATS